MLLREELNTLDVVPLTHTGLRGLHPMWIPPEPAPTNPPVLCISADIVVGTNWHHIAHC